MNESSDPPKQRRSFLKPLLVLGMVLILGWWFSQGEPTIPDARAGEAVYELQLTPL